MNNETKLPQSQPSVNLSLQKNVELKKENLLNKICDEIEGECFSSTSDYSREKMKERLLPLLTGGYVENYPDLHEDTFKKLAD